MNERCESDTPQGLTLTWTLNAPALPATSDKRLVYLLVESGGLNSDSVLPINVALVVDVSESMHIRVATDEQFRKLAAQGMLQEVLIDGVPAWQSTDIPNEVLTRLPRKIDRVRDALLAAVEQLRPADRFALVAFAGRAITLIPNTDGGEKGRLLVVVNRLDELELGDDTRIGQGMALGLDELQQGASEDLADRLLVLTDGFTLDEELCRQSAARARQIRIPISTMGLGGEFNEELMIPIADQTGGEAYLIEDPKEIPAVFARELQRAQAVRYRNLELKLRPSQGVEVRAAYRVRPSIAPLESVNDGESYSFQLGDLVVGEEPTLLLEIMVPPRPAGLYRLAQALLACDNPGSSLSGLKTRTNIVVEYTADVSRAKQRVAQVMDVVEALSAYKLQRGAQAALEAGDVAGATRKLRAAATRLLDMGQEELAAETERQAVALEKRGQADPRLTKKLRYETRKLTAHLGSTATDV